MQKKYQPFTLEEEKYFSFRVKEEVFPFLTPSDLLMLRTIRLFLKGDSYETIAKKLNINRSTVSKQLRKKKVKEYLRREYYRLFYTQFKNTENIYAPISTKSYLAYQEGAKEKLAKSTYYRYRKQIQKGDGKMEFVLEDLIHAKEKEKKFDTKEKQKLATIILHLFSTPHVSYQKISEKTGISSTLVVSYLHRFNLMEQLFEKDYTEEIKNIVLWLDQEVIMQKEQEKNMPKIKFYDNLISTYLENYYTFSSLENHLKINDVDQKLKHPFIEEFYGPEIVKQIEEKTQEIKSHHIANRNGRVIIRDQKRRKYINPEVFKVSKYQDTCLTILDVFFENYGNIQKTYVTFSKTQEYTYNYILSSLKAKELEEILNEETKEKLQKLLKLEERMQSTSYSYKKSLVENLVNLYFKYNGNIYECLKEFPITKEEFFRVLLDDYTKKYIGEEYYQNMKDTIETYNQKEFVYKTLQKSREKR